MNVLSRRLRELEDNVLGFPPEDDDILLHVGNYDERLLHDRAQKIRATMEGHNSGNNRQRRKPRAAERGSQTASWQVK